MKRLFSTACFVFLGLTFCLAVETTASAAEITVTGSTTGAVTGVPPLTFTGNAFTGTTAFNVGALSGPNNLGTFTLGTAPIQIVSGTFTLNITFTAPTGIASGQNALFSATAIGTVSPNLDQGGVLIHFTDPVQQFPFSIPGAVVGEFDLTLTDVAVQSGRSASLTAQITGNQSSIPEPATWMLFLGGGMTGLMGRRWLRRRS